MNDDFNPVRLYELSLGSLPGIRSEPGSLQLDLPAPSGVFLQHFGKLISWSLHFTQIARCSVAQLPREVAKLVSAVAVGSGLGARHHPGAAQVLGAQRVIHHLLRLEAEQRHGGTGHRHKARLLQRLRLHSGETRPADCPHSWGLRLLHGELSQHHIVEVQPLERGQTGRYRRSHGVHGIRAEHGAGVHNVRSD